MNTFSIDRFLCISGGIPVEKNGTTFQIDFCGYMSKTIHKIQQSDLVEGKIMQLFPIIDYKKRQLNLNHYFGNGKTGGVILFLEHVNFIRDQTLLGKRLWLQPSTSKGGDCGLLIIGFDSTGVIAVQIDGEVFLFSQEHPGVTCSISKDEFDKLKRKTSLEKHPRVALANEVTWLILQNHQDDAVDPNKTIGPILESALKKKKL